MVSDNYTQEEVSEDEKTIGFFGDPAQRTEEPTSPFCVKPLEHKSVVYLELFRTNVPKSHREESTIDTNFSNNSCLSHGVMQPQDMF